MFTVEINCNKLASLKAALVKNYHLACHWLLWKKILTSNNSQQNSIISYQIEPPSLALWPLTMGSSSIKGENSLLAAFCTSAHNNRPWCLFVVTMVIRIGDCLFLAFVSLEKLGSAANRPGFNNLEDLLSSYAASKSFSSYTSFCAVAGFLFSARFVGSLSYICIAQQTKK